MAQYEIDNVPYPIDFQETDHLKRTLQNAKNLLMCRMGEVPYDRMRGFDTDLFDLPISDFTNELTPELDRVLEWEPGVTVTKVETTMLDDGSMYIRVTVDVDDGEEDEED